MPNEEEIPMDFESDFETNRVKLVHADDDCIPDYLVINLKWLAASLVASALWIASYVI